MANDPSFTDDELMEIADQMIDQYHRDLVRDRFVLEELFDYHAAKRPAMEHRQFDEHVIRLQGILRKKFGFEEN